MCKFLKMNKIYLKHPVKSYCSSLTDGSYKSMTRKNEQRLCACYPTHAHSLHNLVCSIVWVWMRSSCSASLCGCRLLLMRTNTPCEGFLHGPQLLPAAHCKLLVVLLSFRSHPAQRQGSSRSVPPGSFKGPWVGTMYSWLYEGNSEVTDTLSP